MNLFSQTYAFGDIASQRELLIATLQITGANSVQIARAIERMENRVNRFYNGTSKYNGNGELKNG